MLVPVFSLQLSNKVFLRTLAVGKFNGKRPSLVGATAGNKVNSIEMRWIGIVWLARALGIHSFSPRSEITCSTIGRKCHSPERQSSGHQSRLWTARWTTAEGSISRWNEYQYHCLWYRPQCRSILQRSEPSSRILCEIVDPFRFPMVLIRSSLVNGVKSPNNWRLSVAIVRFMDSTRKATMCSGQWQEIMSRHWLCSISMVMVTMRSVQCDDEVLHRIDSRSYFLVGRRFGRLRYPSLSWRSVDCRNARNRNYCLTLFVRRSAIRICLIQRHSRCLRTFSAPLAN